MNATYPLITVVIPTYNEEKNIDKCLSSIYKQNYPKNKLEVIVVDDKSSDNTLKIAKKYPVKILISGKRHGEISKMIGFKASRGELFMYLDADIQLRGNSWFRKMTKPLMEDNKISASFTKYYSNSESSLIERYLNFDPLQRDSIYQYFSPKLESLIIKSSHEYKILKYERYKIPPAGLCLYKKNILAPLVRDYDMFLELDFLVLLVVKGYDLFAYVPSAGLYHEHVNSLKDLLRKRKYNLTKVYLARKKRLYKWFDVDTVKGKIRIFLWVLYANLFVPSLVIGLIKSIKHRSVAGVYEPFINLLVTDLIALLMVRHVILKFRLLLF